MASAKKCMIIGAAPVEDVKVFEEFDLSEYFIICADGGFDTAVKYGIDPDFIVGDFDSCDSVPRSLHKKVKQLPPEKDVTDTMYAAMVAMKNQYRSFVLIGCTGGDRCDHTYANYNVMFYLLKKGCSVVMVDEHSKAFMLAGSRISLSGQKDCTVSVFPFGCALSTVSYEGLLYPMSRENLVAGDIVMGVSNKVVSDNASISVHSGTVLIILENKLNKENDL